MDVAPAIARQKKQIGKIIQYISIFMYVEYSAVC